jgi:magnesium-transporting ATPase (P-type)
MFLGTITAVFEIMYYNLIKSHSAGVAATGLYLFLTFTALIVIFSIRNKSHFWRAPRLSRPMKLGFAIISVVSIALVYIPLTKRLLSFSHFSLELFGIMTLITVIYFFALDTVKVWFYKSNLGYSLK